MGTLQFTPLKICVKLYIFEEVTLCIPFWENFPWTLKCLKRLVYSFFLINLYVGTIWLHNANDQEQTYDIYLICLKWVDYDGSKFRIKVKNYK